MKKRPKPVLSFGAQAESNSDLILTKEGSTY